MALWIWCSGATCVSIFLVWCFSLVFVFFLTNGNFFSDLSLLWNTAAGPPDRRYCAEHAFMTSLDNNREPAYRRWSARSGFLHSWWVMHLNKHAFSSSSLTSLMFVSLVLKRFSHWSLSTHIIFQFWSMSLLPLLISVSHHLFSSCIFMQLWTSHSQVTIRRQPSCTRMR